MSASPLLPRKEQMGHSSIQITVDTYGHLIPGADIAWVDRLDSVAAVTPPHLGRTKRPCRNWGTTQKWSERFGCPPGTPIC